MVESKFTFVDHDGFHIHGYRWTPDDPRGLKAIVQLIHGMGDHAGRYRRFAEVLCDNGFVVYAIDHRGHGQTALVDGKYGYLGPDGFTAMVTNTMLVFRTAQAEFPALPLVLMGHSMGSYVVQRFMQDHGDQLNAVVLVGTSGNLGITVRLGVYLVGRFARRYGDEAHYSLTEKMTFTSYNNRFRPVRTPFDWLSRDQAAVDDYMADPMSGRVLTAGSFRDLLIALSQLHTKRSLQKVPTTLPILMVSGDCDPLGKNGASVRSLARALTSSGTAHVQVKLYRGARHDILNEVGKDEVIFDILTWLNDVHL